MVSFERFQIQKLLLFSESIGLMVLILILCFPVSAFAATSIKYGWVALDENNKAVLSGSEYALSGEVRPITQITNDFYGKPVKIDSKKVFYLKNKQAGTAQALILGDAIPGYKDAFITTFKIVKHKSIKSAKIEVKSQMYTGKPLKPAVKVILAGTVLKSDSNYKVKYKNNTNVGKATVTVTGIGKFSEMATTTFNIEKGNISKAKVSKIKNKMYTGKSIKPKPSVTLAGRKLKQGRDYDLSYSKNTKPGIATVIIKGKGNYKGKRTIKFKIVDESTVKLDRSMVMMDVDYYNFAEVVATIVGPHKSSELKWKVSDSKICAFKNKSGKYSSTATGKKPILYARAYGRTTVTVTLPNKKKATLKVRVITSSETDDTGNPPHYYNGEKFYLVNGSWGNDWVEAYVNNAAAIVKAHPNKFKDGPEKNVTTYLQKSLIIHTKSGKQISAVELSNKTTKHTQNDSISSVDGNYYGQHSSFPSIIRTMTKKKGELSPNGYVFLFTHKNQWEYLLKKDSKGVWKVINSKASSAGCDRKSAWTDRVYGENSTLESYCTREFKALYLGRHQLLLSMTYTTHGGHLIHKDTAPGAVGNRPSSHGCIHLGMYDDQIYYDVMVKAGVGTRMISY